MNCLRKYLLFISYIGTDFSGSQAQILKEGHLITVQSVLEKTLQYILKLSGDRPINLRLASRTDTNVHALRAAASVYLPSYKKGFINCDFLKHQLNSLLSDRYNIRVLEVHKVVNSFRFSDVSIEKCYLYRIGNLKREFEYKEHKHLLPISENERTYFVRPKAFDLSKAQKAADLFVGVNDFKAICGRPTHNTRPTVCDIKSFTVEKAQPLMAFDPISSRYDFYHFTCIGNRFLFHLVRRMVTLAFSVGVGYFDSSVIEQLLQTGDTSYWPKKIISEVPGWGLYLVNAKFDFEKYILTEHDCAKDYKKQLSVIDSDSELTISDLNSSVLIKTA